MKASLMSCFLSLLLGGEYFFSSTSAFPGSSLALISSFFSDFIFYCTKTAFCASLPESDFLSVILNTGIVSFLVEFVAFESLTYGRTFCSSNLTV